MESFKHPINDITWVDARTLSPNNYNPNVVMNKELELLRLSMLKQGWIQPIIVAAQLPAIALIAATDSRGVGALIGLPAFALALVLIWGIVRRGLHVQAPQAAAVVAMLIAVGVAVDLTGAAIMKALFSPQS